MENQSTSKHTGPEIEDSQSEFGQHPMSQSGFSESGDSPSMTPPPLNLGGGGEGVIQRSESGTGSMGQTSSPGGSGSVSPGGGGTGGQGGGSNPPPQPQTRHGDIHDFEQPPSTTGQQNDSAGQQNEPAGQQNEAASTPEENVDFVFFGVNVPKVAPSTTLGPIPQTHRDRINPAIGDLQTKQSELKDNSGVAKDGEKLAQESKAAAAIPENEGRKEQAETKMQTAFDNQGTRGDVEGAKTNIGSKITTFDASDEKIEAFANASDGITSDITGILNEVRTKIPGESAEVEAISDIQDSYAHNQQVTPLEDNVKDAEATPEIQLAEGAWPELTEDNHDFTPILDVVENEYTRIAAEKTEGADEMQTLEELKSTPEYQQLLTMVDNDGTQQMETALNVSQNQLGQDMVTAEAGRKLEMERTRNLQLQEVNTKQEAAKLALEQKKQDVANVINRRYDQAKVKVDTILVAARAYLNGTGPLPSGAAGPSGGGGSGGGSNQGTPIYATPREIAQGLANPGEITGYTSPPAASPSTGDATPPGDGYEADMAWALAEFHTAAQTKEDVELPSYVVDWGFGQDLGGFVWSPAAARAARPDFEARMKNIADHYGKVINDAIDACNEEIRLAEGDIQAVITAEDLTEEEKAELLAPLGQLSTDVQAEGAGMTEDLEAKKDETVTEVDDYIASIMVNPLRDLVMDILALIGDGLEWLLVQMLKAAGVSDAQGVVDRIKEAAADIGKIIADAGGFIRTLAEVIGESFIEYFQNFGDNARKVFMDWLTGNQDLTFPTENTIGAWTKFGFGLAGFDVDQGDGNIVSIFTSRLPTEIALPGDLLIPGEVTLNIASSVTALSTGGFSAMWEDLKGQLSNIPIVDEFESDQEGPSTDETLNSPQAILDHFEGLSWEGILAEITQMGVADGLSPAELEETQSIVTELQNQEFGALFQRISGDLEIDLENPGQFLWQEFRDWVQTDLVEQIPGILIQFAGGGIGKIAKAIYDGIRWMITNGPDLIALFGDIFKILPAVANGDKEGAKTLLKSSVNDALALVLDFVTSVGLSISVSNKVQNVIDKVGNSFKKAIDKIIDRIKAAIDKFVKSVKKAMGKKRKPSNSQNNNDQDGQDNRKWAAYPNTRYTKKAKGTEIQGAIRTLKSGINSKIRNENDNSPIENVDDVSYAMDTANKDNNDVKTYQVLQGLKHAYAEDDQYTDNEQAGEAVTLSEAETVARKIFGLHKVFKKFEAIREPNSQKTPSTTNTDQNSNTEEEAPFLSWRWSASPEKTKKRGREEMMERTHTEKVYGSGDNLGVQLYMGGDGKISNVTVSGRPSAAFSGSMGDHTTAFIVQVEGVKRVTINDTIVGAVQGIGTLITQMRDLEGYKLKSVLETENPTHYQRLIASENEMQRLLNLGGNSSTYLDVNANNLQQLIAAYLETRELVPLSTFDISQKSGSGGQGKGEGSSIEILRAYEQRTDEIPDSRIKSVIEDLFDAKSSSTVMIESDESLRNSMAPGTSGLEAVTLMDKTWNQHLDSIGISFPRTVDVIAKFNMRDIYKVPEGEGSEAAMDALKENGNFEAIVSAAYKDLLDEGKDAQAGFNLYAVSSRQVSHLKSTIPKWVKNQRHYVRWRNNGGPATIKNMDSSTAIENTLSEPSGGLNPYFETVKGRQEFAELQLTYVRAVRKFDKAIASVDLIKKLSDIESDPRYAVISNIEGELKDQKSLAEFTFNNTFSPNGDQSIGYVQPNQRDYETTKTEVNQHNPQSEDEDMDLDLTSSEKPAMEQFRNNFGFQVILGSNRKITEVLSSGRTMSPFGSQTMGAHSIAWTMHVTHAKSLVLGKTVKEAFDSVATELWSFAQEMERERSTTSDKAHLAANRETISATVRSQVRQTGDDINIFLLQELVGNILAFINLIPGSSNRGDHANAGRGEGTAKGRLQDHEDDMWARVSNVPGAGPKSKSESEMKAKIREVFDTDRKLKDKALALLSKGVEKLRETTSGSLIAIQYEILETTFPWTYYTLQVAKEELTSNKKLQSIPTNGDDSKRQRTE